LISAICTGSAALSLRVRLLSTPQARQAPAIAAVPQPNPLGRRAGDGQREERVVLVLHRDDAVVPLRLGGLGRTADPAQILLRHRREHAHGGAPFRSAAIGAQIRRSGQPFFRL